MSDNETKVIEFHYRLQFDTLNSLDILRRNVEAMRAIVAGCNIQVKFEIVQRVLRRRHRQKAIKGEFDVDPIPFN